MRLVILIYFLRTSSVGGGGGGRCAAKLFLFCSLFPVQQTTSGIGHRVKKFFRVGNQYAECEKQRRLFVYFKVNTGVLAVLD